MHARLTEKPDITGRELLAKLRGRKVAVSYYGVWRLLDRAGLSFQKSARWRAGPSRLCAAPGAVAAAAGQS